MAKAQNIIDERDITMPWFRKEWIDTDAKALGVYMALLLVRFRVRLRTDIPILYRDEGKTLPLNFPER